MLAAESDGKFTRACVEVNTGHGQSFALAMPHFLHPCLKALRKLCLLKRCGSKSGNRVDMNGVTRIAADASETAATAAKSNRDDTII
jgi:hypothetical protein